MKVGDLVVWWVQTPRRGLLRHAGWIVQTVEARKRPSKRWKLADPGARRTDVSYVVKDTESGKCYWPLVRWLKPIEDESVLRDILDRQSGEAALILSEEKEDE